MTDERRVFWRANPVWAYVLPFALFLLLTSLEAWAPLSAYYPGISIFKIGIVFAVWWSFRQRYPRPERRGMGWAVGVGVGGVIAWILLSRLTLPDLLPEAVAGWFAAGERMAFNPFESLTTPLAAWSFVAVRLVGMTVVVPLMEEVFWRGFLMRWLIAEDFEEVPIGTYSPLSFGVVTLLFALVHPEFVAALVWGTAVSLLLYRTRNLWACVVAHGVTNFLLAVYILWAGAWELW